APLAHRADVDALHLRRHGDVLADGEGAEVGELAPLGVAPRVVLQQVADGAQARGAGERGGGLRSDGVPERRVERRAARHSTPSRSGRPGWPPKKDWLAAEGPGG